MSTESNEEDRHVDKELFMLMTFLRFVGAILSALVVYMGDPFYLQLTLAFGIGYVIAVQLVAAKGFLDRLVLAEHERDVNRDEIDRLHRYYVERIASVNDDDEDSDDDDDDDDDDLEEFSRFDEADQRIYALEEDRTKLIQFLNRIVEWQDVKMSDSLREAFRSLRNGLNELDPQPADKTTADDAGDAGSERLRT